MGFTQGAGVAAAEIVVFIYWADVGIIRRDCLRIVKDVVARQVSRGGYVVPHRIARSVVVPNKRVVVDVTARNIRPAVQRAFHPARACGRLVL